MRINLHPFQKQPQLNASQSAQYVLFALYDIIPIFSLKVKTDKYRNYFLTCLIGHVKGNLRVNLCSFPPIVREKLSSKWNLQVSTHNSFVSQLVEMKLNFRE